MQLSVSDVAQHLDVSEKTVYQWIRQGAIPFTRVNEQYRVSSTELLEWAIARGHKLSADVIRHTHGDPKGLTLSQALRDGGVHHLEGPQTRSGLLAALVDACVGLDPADKRTLLELLTASESMGTTALGEGLAVPHVRTPIIVHGSPTRLATWYLKSPVDFFAARDGKPVDTVFFVATPTPRAHLHLVSQLMMALHDQAFRQAVIDRAPLERLLAESSRIDVAASELAAAQRAVRSME